MYLIFNIHLLNKIFIIIVFYFFRRPAGSPCAASCSDITVSLNFLFCAYCCSKYERLHDSAHYECYVLIPLQLSLARRIVFK